MVQTKRYTSVILLSLLGFIWGSGYSLARYATTHGVNPLGYSFWQSLGPAVLLLIITKVMGIKFPSGKRHLLFYFFCGLLGIALPNTNMYLTSPHLPAGLLAVIVNTVPIFTYVLAFLAGQERLRMVRLIGVILAVAGLLCLVLPQTELSIRGAIPWLLLALITPLCFATYATFVAKHSQADHPLALATGMLIFSAIQLALPVWISKQFYVFHWPLNMADYAVLVEIILSSLGYVILFQLLKTAGAVYYSMVGGVVALTGLFWGWLFFGEVLTRWLALAVLLILIGITVVTFTQAKQR